MAFFFFPDSLHVCKSSVNPFPSELWGKLYAREKTLVFYEVSTENHKASTIQHSPLLHTSPGCAQILVTPPCAQSWVKPQGQITHLGYTERIREIKTGIRCMCTHLDFAAVYEQHIIGWNIHIILWVLGEKSKER